MRFRWTRISLCAILLAPFALVARANTLTITSNPSGATVEIDGVVVGTTPYTAKLPGGYFHKPHTIFGARLEHAMVARVYKDGYTYQQLTLTEGPFEWRNVEGRTYGNYWLMKTEHFEVSLDPLTKAFTGKPEIKSVTSEGEPRSQNLPVETIVQNVNPAIVRVEGDKAWGSGFFVTDTGLIATNKHVVDGQSNLFVITSSRERIAAKVVYVGSDVDIAILKVNGADFAHLPLTPINSVQQGEPVIAIGHPDGGLPNTVTKGIVSAIGPDRNLGSGTWIQTDAAINPGNSGGPLLDSSGTVVGINTMKTVGPGVQGLNFALSAQNLIDVLRRFYPASDSAETGKQPGGSAVVDVTSDPAGADIYVDGAFVGNTPSVLHLSTGTHAIKIQSTGKKAWERQLEVLKDSKVTLSAALDPQT
jgi:S1-C subfamily serine protease